MANTNLTPSAGDLNLSLNTPRITTPVAVLALVGNVPGLVNGDPTVLQGLGGTLTMTGVAPTTIIATLNTPPTGTLTITGNAPATSNAPAAGALTLTGAAGSLLLGTVFIPPPGALTLSIGVSTVPSAGAVTLTGAAPTVQTGTISPELSPAAGSLALTGGQSNLSVGVGSVALSPDSGHLFFGEPVYFTQAGTLTLAGAAVTLLQNAIRPAGAGALALTGVAGEVLLNRPLTVPAGTLTLAGQLAVISGLQLTPASATLALTGTPPNLSRPIIPPTGALVLEGQTGGFPGADQVQPPTAALALTGRVSDIFLSLAVALQPPTAAGVLVLAGIAPRVETGIVAIPAAGALDLTGQAVTIPGLMVMPPTGALTVQGELPLKVIEGPTDLTPATGALGLAGAVPGVQSLRLTRGYRFTARIRRGARVPRRAE